MPAVHPRLARQSGELAKRRPHLSWRALEQLAAARREQRIAAEHDGDAVHAAGVRDMPRGMSGDIEHVERTADAAHVDHVIFRECARARGNRLAGRTVDRRPVPLGELAHAAHMVAVVVGGKDLRDRETLALHVVEHGHRIARVDDRRLRALAQHPDVVVAECGDRDNRRHGRIFRSAGSGVNVARRLVRDAARPVSARARAGVLRSNGRRHLRFLRAADRPARSAVPHAKPHSAAIHRRLRPARRSDRGSALAPVPRELDRPDRDAARARVHRRSAPDAARGVPRDPAGRTDRHLRASTRSRCSAPSATSAASSSRRGTAASSRSIE